MRRESDIVCKWYENLGVSVPANKCATRNRTWFSETTGITRAELWWSQDDNSDNESKFIIGRVILMNTDPVCGMKVEQGNSKYQSQYGGREYTFCSQECKNRFDQQPEKFAKSAA